MWIPIKLVANPSAGGGCILDPPLAGNLCPRGAAGKRVAQFMDFELGS
jgi:hypothetical protein